MLTAVREVDPPPWLRRGQLGICQLAALSIIGVLQGGCRYGDNGWHADETYLCTAMV